MKYMSERQRERDGEIGHMLCRIGLRFAIEMVKSSRERACWKAESWSENQNDQEFNSTPQI